MRTFFMIVEVVADSICSVLYWYLLMILCALNSSATLIANEYPPCAMKGGVGVIKLGDGADAVVLHLSLHLHHDPVCQRPALEQLEISFM